MPTAAMNEALPAVRTIGPALPRGSFDTLVLGVYRAAVNLRLAGCDTLASLTGPSGEGLPGAISLAAEVDFRAFGLAVGARGSLDDSTLALDAAFFPLRIDLGGAARLAPRPMPRIERIGESFRTLLAELGRIQDSKKTELRIGTLVDTTRPATPAAATIRRGAALLATGSPDSAAAAIGLLIGTGPGLTPSGDDFLAGYLASAIARRAEAFAALAREVEAGSKATNELSASLLRQASRGHFSPALIDLAEALAGNSISPAVTALRRLCAHGHSSGADMASGFLFGLGATRLSRTELHDSAIGTERRRQHAS